MFESYVIYLFLNFNMPKQNGLTFNRWCWGSWTPRSMINIKLITDNLEYSINGSIMGWNRPKYYISIVFDSNTACWHVNEIPNVYIISKLQSAKIKWLMLKTQRFIFSIKLMHKVQWRENSHHSDILKSILNL